MNAMIIFLLSRPVFAQDDAVECNLTVVVSCEDCQAGQKFPAELYTFTADGTSRYVLDHGTVESGGQLSGKAVNPRRTLSVYGQDLGSWKCTGQNLTVTANITNKDLGLHSLRPDPSFVSDDEVDDDTGGDPFGEADLDDDPPVEAESLVYHPPSPSAPEPVAPPVPVLTMSAAPPSPVASVPDPPARVVVDEEPVDTAVMPRVVGWAAPGGDPVWTGNAGDYPSSPAANRRGKFAEYGVSRCPADKLPAVLGTADHISGGRPAQDALDDARANDLAPAEWNGAYAIALRTAILGDQAAAVWCIEPGDINPTSAEGRQMVAAAEPPPLPLGDLVVEQITGPVNLPAGGETMFSATLRNTGDAPVAASAVRFAVDGITLADVAVPPLNPGEDATVQSPIWTATSAGLHTPRATADVNNVVPEANEWDNTRDSVLDVAAPPTVAAPVEPAATPTRVILRKGLVLSAQYATTVKGEEEAHYLHFLAGAFVTFNLTKKEWLGVEPYLQMGSDGKSTHPCGFSQDGELTTCSGVYLSVTGGVRVPVTVFKSDALRVMVFPDLSLLSDDMTTGFTSWADFVSVRGGAELWLTGKIPLAFALEAGGSRVSFLNDDQLHQNGYMMPVEFNVKVAFK